MKLVRHEWEAPLTVRDDGETGDGRTLVGLAVPYDTELDVMDLGQAYTEVFRRGAFAKTIRDRRQGVPLLVAHDFRQVPVGVSTHLEETDAGLAVAFHLLSHHSGADMVLAAVREGAMSGLSIGFEPGDHKVTAGYDRSPPADRDLVERKTVALREVSICNFPAYVDAGVTGVRSASSSTHPSLSSLAADRAHLAAVAAGHLDRWGRVVRR